MSKSVNVRFFLQRVIAAACFLLALWIFYTKLLSDEDTLIETDPFRNPSIAKTTPIPVRSFFIQNVKQRFSYQGNSVTNI